MDNDRLEALRSLGRRADARLGGLIESVSGSMNLGTAARVEDVCLAFYDEHLLSRLDQPDATDDFVASMGESLARADDDFGRYVGWDEFRFELLALRFELFGLAMTHRIGWRREDVCLRELVATRRYLEERGELRTWEAMSEYGKAIAEAGLRMSQEQVDRARNMLTIRIRLNGRRTLPPGCLEHYVNRYDSEATWRRGAAMPSLLQTLVHRLDFHPNAQGLMRLQTMLGVFYDSSARRLRGLRLL